MKATLPFVAALILYLLTMSPAAGRARLLLSHEQHNTSENAARQEPRPPALTTTSAQDTKKPRVDALGDPLPAQALHRFGTSRFCTQTEVTSLAMSHDGKLLAAADREGRVYLWDADTGKQRFITSAGSGKRVVISPDGRWLAFGEEGMFEVRNLHKDDPPRLTLGAAPRVFAFSPDSKAIAMSMADETDIRVYDIESGQELRRFAGVDSIVRVMAFSSDGKLLAAAAMPEPTPEDENPEVRLMVWDAQKGKVLKDWTHAAKRVKTIAFLPDNKTLVAQFTTRLQAWNALTGEAQPKIATIVGTSFAFDAACKTFASTDGPRVMDFASGKELHTFQAPTLLRHIAMSGDGKLIAATAQRFETASPRIMLWDVATGKPREIAAEHRHYVDAVAFSHDAQSIATASNVEGYARLWDAKSAKLLHALNLDSLAAKKSGGPRSRRTLVDALAFSADRPELFIAGQRWDVKIGTPIPLKGDDDFVFEQANSRRAILSPDARIAASFLNGNEIQFWDPAKAEVIKTIAPTDKKSRADWSAFAFAPNRKQAAAGRWFPPIKEIVDDVLPPTIQLWDIDAGKSVKSFRSSPTPVARLMFSPDGETLAVIGFPTRLELWHLPTGRLLREMYLDDQEELPRVYSTPTVAFSPHGQWIAFTHKEGEIVLVETLTGKEIQTLRGHQGYISSLAFSPDNRRLLSGGRDTTALLWAIAPENPVLPASWKDADRLWLEMGAPPNRAYGIVWALMAHPDRAIEVLTMRLQKDEGASDKEIRELITNLSSAKFVQRDTAMRRLKAIGTRSLPALEESLKKSPDLETTRRIQELLRTVETTLTPETLRDLRGMQVLEMIGTPAARKLLAEVASGDPGAGKTRHAQAALQRLKATD
jgi:WD40 repeat protein